MGFGFRWWFGLHCCVYGLGWRLDSLQSQLFTGIMWLGPGSDGCTPAAGMHHRQHADKMEYAGGRWGMRLSFVGGMRPTLPAAGSSCWTLFLVLRSGASEWQQQLYAFLVAARGTSGFGWSYSWAVQPRLEFAGAVRIFVAKCCWSCVARAMCCVLTRCGLGCSSFVVALAGKSCVVMCLNRALSHFNGPLKRCAVFEVLALLYLTCRTCSTGRPDLALTCSNPVGQVGETQVKG